MIWVLLWAGGLIAFLYYFFGRRWLYVLLFPVGLAALVALLWGAYALQDAIVERGYSGALRIASTIGWVILICAVTGLVFSIAVLVTDAIRYGSPDEDEGTVLTEDRPMTTSLGNPLAMGRSKKRVILSRHEFVPMESLVDGSASIRDRVVAAGIGGMLASFFLVFVGVALIAVKASVVFLLFVTIPAIWFGRIVRHALGDYRDAKKKVAT